MMGNFKKSQLSPVEIHDVLSNERRWRALQLLYEADEDEVLTVHSLAELIAEFETDESPPPRNIRRSAYVSLYQTHLPKLAELGIVAYDQSGTTVELEAGAQDVAVYMEAVPQYGISWSEYYAFVSLVGILLLIATTIGVPPVSEMSDVLVASSVMLLILLSAVYQIVEREAISFPRA